ncbi:MAG: response regulator [Candidatus Riflebacteria bacterium]|nr:response regulator [Candidatus Riflebacteria bacterium]
MKILIVDDNANDRRLLKYIVEKKGHDAQEAEDGLQGLRITRNQKPDLVISDVLMPVMDGFEFLRAVKGDDAVKSIPFMFYSASYNADKDVALALSLGAAAYIVKPKEPAEIWNEVESTLDKSRKEKVMAAKQIEDDAEYLKRYREVLTIKLEEKVKELETTEKALRLNEDRLETLFKLTQMTSLPEGELADFALEEAVRLTRSRVGYLHFYSEDLKSLILYSWSKNALKECTAANTSHYPLDSAGVWADCIRLRKPVIHNDYQSLPGRKGYPEGHFQVKRHMSVPIMDGKTIVAVAGVGNKEEPYNDTDVRQLSLFMSSMWGILKQKRGQQEIYDLASIIRTIPDAVCSIDATGRFVSWNKAAENLFGYTEKEIIGQNILVIMPPDLGVREVEHCVGTLNETGVISSYETTRIKRDGSRIPVELTAVALRDDTGKPVRYASIMKDISERKKLEEQLLQAQKMEAIGLFAGGVAHDFNNLLSAIIGYGELALLKMSGDDPLRNNIDTILEGANQAAHLTKDLLLFSRKQVAERKPDDLNGILSKAEKFLRRVIGEDIEFKTILPDKSLSILADSHQIRQVLMNLATNARDAMPNGGSFTVVAELISLSADSIAATGGFKPGSYAIMTVSDTGKGMSAETRKRIFEPFFTTKEVGKGTGLGLSVVYAIVKQHDGFINVYSEPGLGTTFKIYLPLLETQVQEETLLPKEEIPGGNETVLLAEDSEPVRELIRVILTRFGYSVIEAVDGQDAVTKFMENKEKIQFFLCDLIMPRMNGKEAYDNIVRIMPGIKVLFMSGYSRGIAEDKLAIRDDMPLISKPVVPRELLTQIRAILDKS